MEDDKIQVNSEDFSNQLLTEEDKKEIMSNFWNFLKINGIYHLDEEE